MSGKVILITLECPGCGEECRQVKLASSNVITKVDELEYRGQISIGEIVWQTNTFKLYCRNCEFDNTEVQFINLN